MKLGFINNEYRPYLKEVTGDFELPFPHGEDMFLTSFQVLNNPSREAVSSEEQSAASSEATVVESLQDSRAGP